MPITSINSSTQSVWQQAQLQRAQGTVDQAKLTARTLRVQADSAQAAADKAQADADTLKSRAAQAQNAADQANLLLQLQSSLAQVGTQVTVRLANALPTPPPPAATTSAAPASLPGKTTGTSSQATGSIINTTA